MAGLNDTPQANQKISSTQAPIRENFTTFIEPGFAINHIGFNQGLNTGKHNFVQMPVTTAAGPTGAGEIALFCQNSVINTTPNTPSLWLAKQSTALASAIEFSEYQTGTYTNGTELTQNYLVFKLPNGLIVKAAQVIADVSNRSFPQTLTFKVDASLPVFSNIYYRGVNYTNTDGDDQENDTCLVQLDMSDNTKITITAFNDTLTAKNGFYYLVIGS